MPKFFVEENQFKNDIIKITEDNFNHIKNVLRCKLGDEIEICINKASYLTSIIEINKDNILCKIKEKIDVSKESKIHINIVQGIPKADKMELIIQKCTELGVKEFTPLELKRCIVKLDDKDKNKKIERWQKIAEIASKQCGRDIIPKVNSVYNVNNLFQFLKNYDIILVAYENEEENSLKKELKKINISTNTKIAIVIGPEGGLEENEVEKLNENGAKIISLGKRILRTETVGLAITSIIMYEFNEME